MKISSRTILFICLLFSVIATSCNTQPTTSPQPAASSAEPEKLTSIRLPVGYIPNIQFAPLYMAMEKGYFRQAGIDITLDNSMENDNVALVGAGKNPFAIASGEQVLIGRAHDMPIVYVTAWYQQYPVGIVAKTSANIKKLADLKGKRIGIPILSGASYVGFRALLSAGDLKESDVTLDVLGYNQIESLVSDTTQAGVIYVANEPVQLKSQGVDIDVIKVSDYLKLVSNGLITNEKTIKENPELVKKMVSCLLKGITDTLANQDEAYEISKKYIENLAKADETVQKQVLKSSAEMWLAPRIGYSDPDAWKNMHKVLSEIGMIESSLAIEPAFSNDFLPEQ